MTKLNALAATTCQHFLIRVHNKRQTMEVRSGADGVNARPSSLWHFQKGEGKWWDLHQLPKPDRKEKEKEMRRRGGGDREVKWDGRQRRRGGGKSLTRNQALGMAKESVHLLKQCTLSHSPLPVTGQHPGWMGCKLIPASLKPALHTKIQSANAKRRAVS